MEMDRSDTVIDAALPESQVSALVFYPRALADGFVIPIKAGAPH